MLDIVDEQFLLSSMDLKRLGDVWTRPHSSVFPSRRCGHSLSGRRVRHLQRRPTGLLRGGPGAAGGRRSEAHGGDGEEAGEGRVHRRHDPRSEVKRTDNP